MKSHTRHPIDPDTLYVSDLDGTLLNDKAKLSPYTIQTLNTLIGQGLQFTVATARGAKAASRILSPLELSLPLILMNGSQIYDQVEQKYLDVVVPQLSIIESIISILATHGINGFMYGMEDGVQSAYYDRLSTQPMMDFYQSRTKKKTQQFHQVESLAMAKKQSIFYFATLDREEKLRPATRALLDVEGLNYSFYPDNYAHGYWFLEIYDERASKKRGVEWLRMHYDYANVVAFGDNLNDISLFEAADVSYAVANALSDLAQMASGTIGSNMDDGVAQWLSKRYQGQRGLLP